MPIRPEEIDQSIHLALKDRLAQIFQQPATVVDPSLARLRSAGTQKWRETAKRHVANFWIGGACFFSGILSVPMLEARNEGMAVLAMLGGFALGVSLIVRGFSKTNQELTQYVSPDVLRIAADLIGLSRAEKLYCDSVASLIDAGPVLTETTQTEILRQLNDLLTSHRKLDGPVRQYLSAGGSSSIEELERELAALSVSRDSKSDTMARATMDQSIGLCQQRLSAAKALGPAREQAEAQQELIIQALASVQGSLARMVASGSGTSDADVSALHASVNQVNQQTRAVEDAVGEVLTLRV
jgi:hypothetical protein